MNVKQFIDGYNKTTKGQEEYVKKHIVKQYLPYTEKISIGARIINTTMYAGDAIKVFKMNTPVKSMFLALAIVDAYSDIDFEFKVEEYDELVSSGAMSQLLLAIPDTELTACQATVDSMIADELENTRNVVSFFETKIDSLKAVFDSLLDVVDSLNIPIENKTEE